MEDFSKLEREEWHHIIYDINYLIFIYEMVFHLFFILIKTNIYFYTMRKFALFIFALAVFIVSCHEELVL